MAKKECTCFVCKKKFDRNAEQAVRYTPSPRYYAHQSCFPSGELVPMEKPKDNTDPDLKELKEYIGKLYGNSANWVLINKQIKTYKEENGYSYSGMLKSLVYFYSIKNNSVDNSKGIGIIPYVYQDAYNYYYNLFIIANANNHINDIKSFVSQEKEIVIKEPKRKPAFFRRLFNLEDEE